MKKCITAQLVRVTVLANFLLLPVVAWAEVEWDSIPIPLAGFAAERVETLGLQVSRGGVSAYDISAALSLSQTGAVRPPDKPDSADWSGIRKDTAYFLGYQFSIIGVLYVMPASISGWTDETKDDFSIQQYKDNVSQIVWDKDDWWLNYVLHPYWGGVYYVRAQQRGFGPMGSFLYAATLSSLYEFGAEAFFEEPSIQDLIVTPVAGYFVGKYFMEVRANIYQNSAGELSATDKFILVMTDPMGAMNEMVEGWFGKNSEVSLRPMIGPQFRAPIASENAYYQSGQRLYTGRSDFGVKMTMRW